MKLLTTLIAIAISMLLVNNSHAQTSWGTQDTSINWIGFDWSDLGVGGYATNTDGWGIVGNALDLGDIDASLAGLTVDIRVNKSDTTTNSSWSAAAAGTLSTARLGGVLLQFKFSGPVAFRRKPITSVAFGSGEIETYTSTSLDYMEQAGTLNLVGGVSIDNIAGDFPNSFGISVEDYNTTFFSMNWDDDVGAALTQAIHFEIGVAVPEPSSLIVLSPFLCGLVLRRRRKLA